MMFEIMEMEQHSTRSGKLEALSAKHKEIKLFNVNIKISAYYLSNLLRLYLHLYILNIVPQVNDESSKSHN